MGLGVPFWPRQVEWVQSAIKYHSFWLQMPLARVVRLPGRVGARLMAMFIAQSIISS